jgi:hypothetical protein
VDLTPFVAAGKTFDLKIEVSGRRMPPYADQRGYPLWPIGQPSQPEIDARFAGIVDTVWLRAYGAVRIEDAFIKLSWRKKSIEVAYTLVNGTTAPATFRIEADAILEATGATEATFAGPEATLAAGETRVVEAVFPWKDAKAWWPDDPVLYGLGSSLVSGKKTLDSELRRFGFREIWIEGNRYLLNGIPTRMWGDYTLYGQERYWPGEHGPEVFEQTIRKLKDLNIRLFRWHKQPPPQYVLDMSDAAGLMIVAESAINGAEGESIWSKMDQATFRRNALAWIEPWVKANRNHPSIVQWSAWNEFGGWHARVFRDIDGRMLGERIKSLDPTRSVVCDGDQNVGIETVDYHYPEGYDKVPSGGIYDWASLVYLDKPTGMGEVLHIGAELEPTPDKLRIYEANKWMLPFHIRGWRYVGFTGYRPSIYRWARKELHSHRLQLLRNAFAPVALFDREYDDCDVMAYAAGRYPQLIAGETAERVLVLYNDEWKGTKLSAEAALTADGVVVAEASIDCEVPLGERIELSLRLKLPGGLGPRVALRLRVRKDGTERFAEDRPFDVVGDSKAKGIELKMEKKRG